MQRPARGSFLPLFFLRSACKKLSSLLFTLAGTDEDKTLLYSLRRLGKEERGFFGLSSGLGREKKGARVKEGQRGHKRKKDKAREEEEGQIEFYCLRSQNIYWRLRTLTG